ncbi:MAG: riboflavin synthase [Fimbriimonas sp.]|nr:riboflavin synthase [Fimbriimonas sp.]
MFTGIVQAVGKVESWDGQCLVVDPGSLELNDLAMGESIAVNGCCLTVVPGQEPGLSFDLSPETVQKTTFSSLRPGQELNLERAMRPTDRFGGHIVQGHVDGIGQFLGKRTEGNAVVYQFSVDIGTYLIDKGSVTVNGISLTVVSPHEGKFEVWIIPHTLENTNLRSLAQDQEVNIEYDVIAKYVEKLRLPYRTV